MGEKMGGLRNILATAGGSCGGLFVIEGVP